jgi:propanol-preferring alcohol dehydrogenase
MQPLWGTRARVVFVVLFEGKLGLNLVKMPARAYRLIISSYYTGTLKDLMELVSLEKRGRIRTFFLDRLKLSQAIEALLMLKDRKIMERGV